MAAVDWIRIFLSVQSPAAPARHSPTLVQDFNEQSWKFHANGKNLKIDKNWKKRAIPDTFALQQARFILVLMEATTAQKWHK